MPNRVMKGFPKIGKPFGFGKVRHLTESIFQTRARVYLIEIIFLICTKAAANIEKIVKSSTIANLCNICYNKSNYVKNYIQQGTQYPRGTLQNIHQAYFRCRNDAYK